MLYQRYRMLVVARPRVQAILGSVDFPFLPTPETRTLYPAASYPNREPVFWYHLSLIEIWPRTFFKFRPVEIYLAT
jgi:hypothetical protein